MKKINPNFQKLLKYEIKTNNKFMSKNFYKKWTVWVRVILIWIFDLTVSKSREKCDFNKITTILLTYFAANEKNVQKKYSN